MKILAKITISVLSLFLGGCAHYGGYHSGYSTTGSYDVSVSSYTPHHAYPFYYDHDYYGHNPFAYKHHGQKSHREKQHHGSDKHDKHYSKPYRNNKHSQHRHKKRSDYYVGRESTKPYYPESQYRDNKPSRNYTPQRFNSTGKHRRKKNDDRHSGTNFRHHR